MQDFGRLPIPIQDFTYSEQLGGVTYQQHRSIHQLLVSNMNFCLLTYQVHRLFTNYIVQFPISVVLLTNCNVYSTTMLFSY